MKDLLIDTERYTPEEVGVILKANDKSYKNQAERVLCRLFINNAAKSDGSPLWLMPWCIDRLKQYVRDKKAYRFWIKYLEFKERPMDVKKAFDQLVMNKNSRKASLANLKYMSLTKLDRQNRDQLSSLNTKMATDTLTLYDLKGQRDFLISKMVSSQKLAFIRCNFSFKLAKEKAFKRLRDNAYKQEKV